MDSTSFREATDSSASDTFSARIVTVGSDSSIFYLLQEQMEQQHTIDIDEREHRQEEEEEEEEEERPCIFRVHEELRHVNEKAYTPVLVSIGPYHHGQPKLLPMERDKERCLRLLLQSNGQEEEHYLNRMRRLEERARKYYANPVDLDRESFAKMLLNDACFVIHFLRGFGQFFEESWKTLRIYRDLMLLENQLPFFVISEFYDMSYPPNPNPERPTLDGLTLEPFIHLLPRKSRKSRIDYANASAPESKHFLDWVHNVCRPSSNFRDKSNQEPVPERKHFLDWVRNVCRPSSNLRDESIDHQNTNQRSVPEGKHFLHWVRNVCHPSSNFRDKSNDHQSTNQGPCIKMPSMTELMDAGVNFDADGLSHNLFDIRFEHGHFKIPKLQVNDSTEIFFRNIIAYEQHSSDDKPQYFSDYTYFMDLLINSKEDVNQLRHHEILECMLGDDKEVAVLFNKLGQGIIILNGFHYSELCNKVTNHSKTKYNRLRAALKRDYFKNIWFTVATVAAAFLLFLTLVQTIFSVITFVKTPFPH